jgi:hypothetical protein
MNDFKYITYNLFSVLIFICLSAANLIGQKGNPGVKIKSIDVQNNKVIIEYDIINFNPGQQFDIGIYFLDDKSKSHYPKTLSGDIGNNVLGGADRKIIWDISKDYDELNFLLRPQFIVNGLKQGSHFGGLKWAYLSMVMPGMGDYFVTNYKETTIKPYYRTAAFLTLVALGVKGVSERTIEKELKFTGYQREFWGRGGNAWSYVIDESGNLIPEYDYFDNPKAWLFLGDYEVFFAAAATIWFLDVLYVANKGKRNEDARQLFLERSNLKLGYFNHYPGLSYSYTF